METTRCCLFTWTPLNKKDDTVRMTKEPSHFPQNVGGVQQRTTNHRLLSYINQRICPLNQPILSISSTEQTSDFKMKVSAALAEIVSEFSGFQHIHTSKSSSSLSSTPSASRKQSTFSESPRHSLNITVGVAPLIAITRNDSSNSLNDFNALQRKNSSASYLVIE